MSGASCRLWPPAWTAARLRATRASNRGRCIVWSPDRARAGATPRSSRVNFLAAGRLAAERLERHSNRRPPPMPRGGATPRGDAARTRYRARARLPRGYGRSALNLPDQLLSVALHLVDIVVGQLAPRRAQWASHAGGADLPHDGGGPAGGGPMIAPFSCCAGERHAHDLLDDLIRTCQHSLGDREPEGLGGLEIQHSRNRRSAPRFVGAPIASTEIGEVPRRHGPGRPPTDSLRREAGGKRAPSFL